MRIDAQLVKVALRQRALGLSSAVAFVSMMTMPAQADGDAARGKVVFARCAACHSIDGKNLIGPPLNGVVGRAAGSVAGARYSRAMIDNHAVWDEQALDGYLAAPAKFLPGTTMTVSLPQAGDRVDLIAYLKTLQSN